MSTEQSLPAKSLEERTESMEIDPKSNKQAKPKKRPGKGAKKRSDEKFRERKNKQEVQKFRDAIIAKYGLYDSDRDSKLESVVSNVQVTPQQQAIPLTITTRSVGLTTAIVYDRTCTTWTPQAIWEICSIHQVYRVHLWLVWLKLYLAQQQQVEGTANSQLLGRIVLSDDIRQVLLTVTQIPSVFSAILDSIGKIIGENQVYHTGVLRAPTNVTEFGMLVQTPELMRALVLSLSDPSTAVETRQRFVRNNPLPGARYEQDLLLNPEDVWPDTSVQHLHADVHAYKNWITRVQNRLPVHMFVEYQWSGRACKSGLVSCEMQNLCITSRFDTRSRPSAGSKRTRSAAGHLQTEEVPPCKYVNSDVYGERTRFWSREALSHTELVMGMAASVGEVCELTTRMEMNAGHVFSHDTVSVLYSLTDAPR